MIEVMGITKTFGDFCALKDLSLQVPTGSVYGLIGPNGAGKSTLIRHLTGAMIPDAGSVLIDGAPVYENIPLKQKIAYIPDDIFFYRTDQLRDLAKLYAGLYPTFDWKLYKRLSEVFRLDEHKQLRRFSKGMQKQAAFLISICIRPEILILDEPVDGLDPVMRRQIWSLVLQDVAERGITVLVSSHNLRELEDVCDHVGILHEGRLLLQRSLSELQDNAVKLQTVLREGTELPEGLNILHSSLSGKIQTLVVRGSQEQISELMESVNPVFYDMVPLNLEEIFVYELGGLDYGITDVLLG